MYLVQCICNSISLIVQYICNSFSNLVFVSTGHTLITTLELKCISCINIRVIIIIIVIILYYYL